jgi:hypothetical protein
VVGWWRGLGRGGGLGVNAAPSAILAYPRSGPLAACPPSLWLPGHPSPSVKMAAPEA